MPSVIRRTALALFAVVAVPSLAGCYATAGDCAGYDVYGYPAAVATTVPTNIYQYPSTTFEGSIAYLVGEHWYTPSEGRWYVLRQEPRELSRYRTYLGAPGVRRAPAPIYGSPTTPGYGYPAPRRAPAYGAPPVYSAPPAYRR